MTPSQINFREPQVVVRTVIGILLVANLVAMTFAFHLIGESPAQLNEQLVSARAGLQAAQLRLTHSRALTHNVELGKQQGDKFLASYMTSRRHTFSTLDSEINKMAETAGMKVGVLNYALPEAIEGSGDLDMMTVTANFEGGYAQLMKFVNDLDRSPRFFLIDSLQVAPQPKGDLLNTTVKLNVFVKDDTGGAQ